MRPLHRPAEAPAPTRAMSDSMKLVSFEKICNDAIHEVGELDFASLKNSLDILSLDQDVIINAVTNYVSSLRAQIAMLGRERTLMTLREINASCNLERKFDEDGRPVRIKREKMRRPQSRGVTGGRRRMDATEMGTGNPSMAYIPRSRNQTFGQTGIGSSSTSSPSIASLGVSGPSSNSSLKNQKEKNFSSLSEANRKYMLRKNIPISQGPIPPSGNSDEEGAEGFVEEDF